MIHIFANGRSSLALNDVSSNQVSRKLTSLSSIFGRYVLKWWRHSTVVAFALSTQSSWVRFWPLVKFDSNQVEYFRWNALSFRKVIHLLTSPAAERFLYTLFFNQTLNSTCKGLLCDLAKARLWVRIPSGANVGEAGEANCPGKFFCNSIFPNTTYQLLGICQQKEYHFQTIYSYVDPGQIWRLGSNHFQKHQTALKEKLHGHASSSNHS